jgi:hypothetical protein
MMASIIVVFGLPITVGAFLPSNAKTRGADIDPDPVCQLVPDFNGKLTWPCGTARWEYLVLVREEEVTIGIISEVRVCLAVFLVISLSMLALARRGGVRTDISVKST